MWGAEVYEQNIRSFVQSINAAISWVPIFIMTRMTNDMVDKMQYGIFFFFASLAALAVPFVFFFVPETKGIALEDIDKLFDKKLSAHNAYKVVMEESRRTVEENKHGNSGILYDEQPKKGEQELVEDAGKELFEDNIRNV